MFDLDAQQEKFKNHAATLTECGNMKILDFKAPASNYYRIRFIFEEDFCRLHISGDLGELVASNYKNMTYEGFSDFVHNPGYFKEKVCCSSRPIYRYEEEEAEKQLKERLEQFKVDVIYDFESEEEIREETINEIMKDFDSETGLGSVAYRILSQIDPDCFEYISNIGKTDTGIIELYLLAFELAKKRLEE